MQDKKYLINSLIGIVLLLILFSFVFILHDAKRQEVGITGRAVGSFSSCSPNPIYLEICDGKDNDCDGGVDEDCKIMIWFYNALDNPTYLKNIIDSGLVTHIMVHAMHRNDLDERYKLNVLNAVDMIKNSNVKIIWSRDLWPYYNQTGTELEDFFNSSYYAREIKLLKQEARAQGIDLVSLDTEPYGDSSIKQYLKNSGFTLTEEQRGNLTNAIKTAVSAEGKVDFIYPAGSLTMSHPYNELAKLGSLTMAENTYYDKEMNIPYSYELFGAFVNSEYGDYLPEHPYYTIETIFNKSYRWKNKMGLWFYPKTENVVRISEQLLAYSNTIKCGNSICDNEIGENCSNCAEDCGACPIITQTCEQAGYECRASCFANETQVNYNCTSGVCCSPQPIEQTCQQRGYFCIPPSNCSSSDRLNYNCDSGVCCSKLPNITIQQDKACAELNGKVCQANEYCDGAINWAKDTQECCLGSCVEEIINITEINKSEFKFDEFLKSYVKDYGFYGIIGILVVLISGTSVVVVSKLRKEKELMGLARGEYNEEKIKEAEKIVSMLKHTKHDKEFIKNLFLEKGWPEDIVEKLLKIS